MRPALDVYTFRSGLSRLRTGERTRLVQRELRSRRWPTE